jgi:hypothetical protein
MSSESRQRRWVRVIGKGTVWSGAAVALVLALLSACEQPNVPGPIAAHGAHEAATISSAKADDVEEILRVVRRLTQPYRDLRAAMAAGYNAQLTPCMESPPAGGMGFHYGAPALVDGTVQPLKPEILMYEPQRNGDLLLVGVEYVVPYTAWTSPNPPTLVGIPFHRNDAFGLWVLHAWIWKHNPSGLLQDWNPRVTCQFAANPS